MNEDFMLTIQELADLEGVEYQTAAGLVRYLRDKGIVKETRNRPSEKRGRTAVEYRLPKHLEITLGTKKPITTEPEPPAAEEAQKTDEATKSAENEAA